jgi:hypothetical protein
MIKKNIFLYHTSVMLTLAGITTVPAELQFNNILTSSPLTNLLNVVHSTLGLFCVADAPTSLFCVMLLSTTTLFIPTANLNTLLAFASGCADKFIKYAFGILCKHLMFPVFSNVKLIANTSVAAIAVNPYGTHVAAGTVLVIDPLTTDIILRSLVRVIDVELTLMNDPADTDMLD